MSSVIASARRVADDVLASAAAATDASGVLPPANLDALAEAGLYALGSGDESFLDVCAAMELLADACLATTFVWVQHVGTLLAVASTENDALRAGWLEPLRAGERRAGAAFSGAALPSPPTLHARRDGDGWHFDGVAPWITGWGHIDVMHAAARSEDGRVVWALVEAREQPGLAIERLALIAVDASATVRGRFDALYVPDARVTAVAPPPAGAGIVAPTVRVHAALSLGVARRCCRLLGPTPLDDELAAARHAADAALGDPDPSAIAGARAAIAELTIRAVSALVVRGGARSAVAGGEAERSAREALFLAVFGSRAPIRAALLEQMGAAEPGPRRRR